jgi:hypothetical protein
MGEVGLPWIHWNERLKRPPLPSTSKEATEVGVSKEREVASPERARKWRRAGGARGEGRQGRARAQRRRERGARGQRVKGRRRRAGGSRWSDEWIRGGGVGSCGTGHTVSCPSGASNIVRTSSLYHYRILFAQRIQRQPPKQRNHK